MLRLCLIYICLTADFQLILSVAVLDTPTLGSKNTPRVVRRDITSGGFQYHSIQNHSVFYQDSQELYVGGTGYVLKLDGENYHIIEKFPLQATERQQCLEETCQNVITVIERFQDSVFVCGTNGHRPQCWKLFPSFSNQSLEIMESYEGTGISPFVHTHNSLSLTVEDDLYAAAPLDSDGSSLQFRRKAGSRTNVWMYDSWVSEPTFISASWVKRQGDPVNEKIYIFFREKNSDPSPEADPWISRIARVCKVDEGGSKRFFQNMWTSFLKARLVCGYPEESLYFNRLQDIYVMSAEDWRDTKIYGLFSSSWNSTAVCMYSIATIEEIFENSTFKGFNQDVPQPRPGTCVINSRSLPRATVNVVKEYPEMTDWVHSLHYVAPFYVSRNNYTKIAVDQVQASDQRTYNVLLLATDSGKIHKVLETGAEPFIISETQLSSRSPIQTIRLDSKKKRLIVGFSEKISSVDLQRCEEYNNSCADCVLSRDPYCAWTAFGCRPTVPGGIQNIKNGRINVCPNTSDGLKPANRTKRKTDPPSPLMTTVVHSVPQNVPFYLSCPIDSYHAKYTWEHSGQSSPCLQMRSNCLHLIPSMAQDNYGDYECVSKERDYRKVVKTYRLVEQRITSENTDRGNTDPFDRSDARALVPQLAWVTLLAEAVWGNFR